MNFKMISALKKRSNLAKIYYKDPSNENKVCFHAHANLCSEMIIKAKEKHSKMSEKLDDPKVSAESYLSIVNSFLNIIKIPNILPIKVNNILISDFTVMPNVFILCRSMYTNR